MLEPLKSRRIIIAGATGGIGSAVARMLGAEGASLAISGRDGKKIESLRRELEGAGVKAFAGVMDATDDAAAGAFFDSAASALGGLDALVALPGMSLPGVIADQPIKEFQTMLDANVTSVFVLAKQFVKRVERGEGGQIVAVGSMAGKRANPTAPGYCAAKAAMAMLLQGLALQVKERKIRVTGVHPGAVDSAFWGSRQVPREKMLQPDDVAEAVRFVLQLPPRVVMHELAFESLEFFK